MLRSLLFSIACSTLISLSLAGYCPDQDLYPCQCLNDQPGYSHPNIICSNEEDLDLTSIFSKVSQDARAIQTKYGIITIKNSKLTEITENAFGNLTFQVIYITEECSSLKTIHSNAFLHQSKRATYLHIRANNIISGPSPYSFYDLVNSFDRLIELEYKSQIGTLDEKLKENGIKKMTLRANAIKGSPFSRMEKIERINLSSGGLSYVSNGALKVGNTKNLDETKLLWIDLSKNNLNGSSFEKGAFTDPSFTNIKISLNLSSNQIEYLDKDIFAPFLLRGNLLTDMSSNQLNCDDRRLAWICESTKSEQIRQAIDIYDPIRCVDNRLLTDCENNFKIQISVDTNLNTSSQDSSPIIFFSSSEQRYDNIPTENILNTSSLMAEYSTIESSTITIETTKETNFSLMGNHYQILPLKGNRDVAIVNSSTIIATFVPTVCVLIIIIVILWIKLYGFCGSGSSGFCQVSSLKLIKCFQTKKKYPSMSDEKLSEAAINFQTIVDENCTEQQESISTNYPDRKNDKSDLTTKSIEGHESIQQGFNIGKSVIGTVDVENNQENHIEYDDNNLYDLDGKILSPYHEWTFNISRFALTERNIQDLKDEKVLLSRDLLTVLTPEIGGGNYGKVFKGLLKSSEDRADEVAVKTLDESHMSISSVDSFIKEGLIMKEFDHENVLSLIGIMVDYNGLPILISPLMLQDVGSFVRKEKNPLTVNLLINFAIQIAQGMAYISSLKYVHRDLAARNCLLDRDEVTVKVSDFGLSRDVYQSNYYRQRSRGAVPWKWMSPESMINNISNHQTDVWSYGVVMWELMTRGVTPYEGLFIADIVSYLKAGNRLPCPSDCPIVLYEIMLKCWNFDPNLRPRFDELVDQVKDVIVI